MRTEISGLHSHSNSGFFETSRFVRMWILCFVCLGVFFFLRQKEEKIPLYKTGAIVKTTVVAKVPFSVVDTSAIDAKYLEHVNEVGHLYAISKNDSFKRLQENEARFYLDEKWRDLMPYFRLEGMLKGNNALFAIFEKMRFGSAKAIQEYKKFLKTDLFYLETPNVDLESGNCLTEPMLERIQQEMVKKYNINPGIAKCIVDSLIEKIWFLNEDGCACKRRKWFTTEIEQQMKQFPAGYVVVKAGETVTREQKIQLEGLQKAMDERAQKNRIEFIVGDALLAAIVIGISLLFLRWYSPEILLSSSSSLMISTIVILELFGVKCYDVIVSHLPREIIDAIRYPILIPGIGMLLCILINPGIAIFLTTIVALIVSFTLNVNGVSFLIVNLFVSFICIFYGKMLRRRAEVAVVCSRGYLVGALIIFAFFMLDPERQFNCLCLDLGISAIFVLVTSVIIIGLLPLFESAFHVLTDINLMEFMNPNSPLLKRLMTEAPGTYQHSLLLGSLSEAAATAIGCDGLFCRAATLYHDIGKVCISQYFSENQEMGMNIHQLLTPKESARIIVSHIQEGVNLARREGLPESFIDIIKEHHGTGLVYYFYHKQLELSGNDPHSFIEKDFRYLGPKPHSKEAAIVMIADSFEAACRSLEDISEQGLLNLINQIVREKIDDGQFDECIMSFEELCKVKKALVKCILSIGHFRIKYPEKKRAEIENSRGSSGYSK